MNTKSLWLLTVFLLACSHLAEAQQPKSPSDRILNGLAVSASTARIEAFRQGLRELGYIEGKNIAIDFRSAEGKLERFLRSCRIGASQS